MTVYKFQDDVDGNFAFVIANTQDEAKAALEEKTSIPVIFISYQPLENHLPIVWINRILPF